jgi:ubiquinone/menaquinone biosynthesis C-methylase UbiE
MASVSHPVFARAFPAMSRALEAGGIAGRRKDLLADLTGEVIDVGAGTGSSFGHYPDTVTRVLAVEPEPRLRALATAVAQAAPVPIEVTSGTASALPAADTSYDAAVVPSCCARSRTRTPRSPRSAGCCGPAADCASWSTSAPTPPGWP